MSSKFSSVRPRRPRATDAVAPARLAGPSVVLDRRVNAWRDDLADIALANRVIAPSYAAPVDMACGFASSPLCGAPNDDAVQVSELLPGEDFAVFDLAGDWAWGQAADDRYVGWVRRAALGPAADAAQRITAPLALVFAAASIKSRVVATLPLGARVAVEPAGADFLRMTGEVAGFLHRRYLEPRSGDAVDFGQAFVGTPYRWGGRTRDGIDCSGLMQILLQAQGVACPRDADQQVRAFPAVAFDERQRGDLLWFPGHIGMLCDPNTLLHANAFWMTTVVEPLDDMLARQDRPRVTIVRPPCEPVGAPL